MMSLTQAALEYISLRRSLGYKLIDAASRLKDFCSFMEREGASYVTAKLALQWAMEPRNVIPAHWSSRLSVVRRFAQYAKAMDPRNEVPPYGLLPYKYQRCNPYIYRDEEVLRLLQACTSFTCGKGLCWHTYYTVFGLLAVTGMRISEVTALDRKDVDLSHQRHRAAGAIDIGLLALDPADRVATPKGPRKLTLTSTSKESNIRAQWVAPVLEPVGRSPMRL